MRTIAVIINGIYLPYHVIDYAIEKAKKNFVEIFALFLRGTREHLTIDYSISGNKLGNSSYTKNFKFKNNRFKGNLVRSTYFVL
jgi:hypothetical protein